MEWFFINVANVLQDITIMNMLVSLNVKFREFMMAALMKAVNFSQVGNIRRCVAYNIVRSVWNKDWKPGPYPQTPEEKAAAAKKYNLSPNEYEPYPDDGSGYGDYPKLPDASAESRDPYYPWDYPEHKRNFGEPLHINADIYSEDRIDVNLKPRIPLSTQVFSLLGIVFGSYAIFYWFEDKHMFRPALPKQYPYEGVVHYTFDQE